MRLVKVTGDRSQFTNGTIIADEQPDFLFAPFSYLTWKNSPILWGGERLAWGRNEL
jgi:hypothetical protein